MKKVQSLEEKDNQLCIKIEKKRTIALMRFFAAAQTWEYKKVFRMYSANRYN